VIRAWDTDSSIDREKKIIAVAPAMNSVSPPPGPLTCQSCADLLLQAMWRHPITAKQIRVLSKDWGVKDTDAVDGDGTTVATPEPAQSEGWFQVINVSPVLSLGEVR